MNNLDKNKIIEYLYNHVDINRLINPVEPEHQRDYLKQEMALA
jgi:hypothetical protein